MREGCRRAPTPHGFHVDVAEHGVQGLRQLRQANYDLVLLDAMMPGLSGLELRERIYEHDIVKIYQGTVGVDSIPGQGTTFTVMLPLAAPGAGV